MGVAAPVQHRLGAPGLIVVPLNEMSEQIFTNDEVARFKEFGHVKLEQAFPIKSALAMQDFMWSELKNLNGIDKTDQSTWTNQWRGLNKTGRHGIYKAVESPRMVGAIDQLLGPDSWTKPEGWGGFLVSFPDNVDEPWDVVAEGWHWDGDPAGDLEGVSGLFIFTFYSQVEPGGGGTLIVEGSHRLIVSFFRKLDPDHLPSKQKGLKRRFSRSNPWLEELTGQTPTSHDRVRRLMQEQTAIDSVPIRVVELTGSPGDAVLCHSSIFHARSFNRSDTPRFMRGGGADPL